MHIYHFMHSYIQSNLIGIVVAKKVGTYELSFFAPMYNWIYLLSIKILNKPIRDHHTLLHGYSAGFISHNTSMLLKLMFCFHFVHSSSQNFVLKLILHKFPPTLIRVIKMTKRKSIECSVAFLDMEFLWKLNQVFLRFFDSEFHRENDEMEIVNVI
jgi:hypothetical protein